MKKEKRSVAVAACFWALVFVLLVHITYQIFGSSFTQSTERRELESIEKSPGVPRLAKSITCDRSHKLYDLCYLSHPTILDPVDATLSTLDPSSTAPKSFEKIQPYPRKWQNQVMSLIKELSLKTTASNATCDITHNSPALVFSTGGYTGNFFHDLMDGFIPLFITINSLFPDQDIILVIANCQDWWLMKYAQLLRQFTRHPIINIDREKGKHCFTSAAVGLISHGPMTVDPNLFPGPNRKTIFDFRAFLDNTFSKGSKNSNLMPQGTYRNVLKKHFVTEGHEKLALQVKPKPRLVLVSRKGNRRILNEDEIQQAAEDIGFDVVVFEPTRKTSLAESFGLFDNSHAVIGVHGAGLTHILFLKPGAVFMQVVPIGFNWLAEICFGKVAVQLGLEYIEYDIEAVESSLVDKYGKYSLELNDPGAVVNGSWPNMGTYLQQDVKLDLVKFRKYLLNAYEKARRFMIRESLSLD